MSTMSADDRIAAARQARSSVPRSSHGDWSPAAGRIDPVTLLTGQDEERLQWLVPVRHGRMADSAFTFYRGAAAIMAQDLATTPASGISAQLCGDAHLANFGSFASPERQQVFDINDFDETLPGPWEWDVKRMATSFVLAARDNGYPEQQEALAAASVAGYRAAMARFASAPTMDVWYAQFDLDMLMKATSAKADRKRIKRSAKSARKRNSEKALTKLSETVDGTLRIRSQPPLLVPLRDLADHMDVEKYRAWIEASFHAYDASIQSDRAHLLRRFQIRDIALKVVGVGSVGTRCFVVLLTGRDHGEPLFLQVKEAVDSVLEAYLPSSEYSEHGERVVAGQRVLQASSDIFLGWSAVQGGHHYYWRQFHDMKGSADVTTMTPDQLASYARVCSWSLAHGHARSGDALAINAYLGRGAAFDKACGRFAVAYADQNEKDYEEFTQAIADGRIETSAG